MKRFAIIILLLGLSLNGIRAQTFNGDLEVYLNSLLDLLPGSSGNQYTLPTLDEMDTWAQVVSLVLNDEYVDATELAATLNYKVTDFNDITDRGGRFYILEEKQPQTKYWGTYVFNREAIRPGLVIQAPHPVFDTNTGLQGVFCFRRLGALALFFSGTHRCNHTQYSACDGSTSVCSGGSQPYRISDHAHNTRSVFYVATQALFNGVEDTTVFVQLHGFAKRDTDPFLIMSNGTRLTPEIDYLDILKEELQEEDPVLTFRVAHQDLDWTRLIAMTNTQGRYINGSGDPCREDATASEGRFLHLEQEKSRLRADSTGWYVMYRALERTFPALPLSSRDAYTAVRETISIYPNPTAGILRIEAGSSFTYRLYSSSGQCILNDRSEGNRAVLDLAHCTPGIYVVCIAQPGGVSHRKVIVK